MQKILIADDEAHIRRLVCDFLRREGYEPLEAEDGEQASLFSCASGYGAHAARCDDAEA